MKTWNFRSPGIPDEEFIRGEIPMSKEELRTVTIAKLRPKNDSIICDIGAGTGSLSIEAALLASEGKVYAVERKKAGVQLIKENMKKFELNNINILEKEAPEGLSSLPMLDRVIIGGSGGKLKEILKIIDKKLKNTGRLVINAITINTLSIAIEVLEEMNYSLEIVNIAVTRTNKVANYHMFKGMNPVYIISAEKGGRR